MDYIALESMKKIADTLEHINKNLERIANNTEKDKVEIIPNVYFPNLGEYYGPVKKELDLGTITCNKNKDGYVDKNIISD